MLTENTKKHQVSIVDVKAGKKFLCPYCETLFKAKKVKKDHVWDFDRIRCYGCGREFFFRLRKG